nr:site-specific integrase [Candidatus Fukatsuia symbiotica]
MSIKMRHGGWHCDFVTPDGKRIRQSLGTTDKRKAQELYDSLKANAWRESKLGEMPHKTFEEACVRWINEKQHKRSLDDDKTKIGFFLLHFSGRNLSSINEEEVIEVVSTMKNRRHRQRWELTQKASLKKGNEPPDFKEKPPSQATRSQYLSFIRGLMRIAANEWGWLEKPLNLKARKPNDKRVRWLSHEEANRLIAVMHENFRPIVVFALATGLRRSNIINLEWDQIDMARQVAWIPPEKAKAGKAIGVALNETACAVLREQRERHSRWVFVRRKKVPGSEGKDTAIITKFRVDDNRAWQTGLKRAGISDFRFHDLRHTWASWLVQSGVPLSALQEMGGWESVEMVRRYAHLSPTHLTEHAKKLDEVITMHGTFLARGKNR